MLAAFERASRRRGQRRTDNARATLLANLNLTEDSLVATSCTSAVARYLLSSADLSRLDRTPIGEGIVARDVSRTLRATYSVRAISCFVTNLRILFFLFERYRFDISRIAICGVDGIAFSSSDNTTIVIEDSSIAIADVSLVARFAISESFVLLFVVLISFVVVSFCQEL